MNTPMNYLDGNTGSNGHLGQLSYELSKMEKSRPQHGRRR
jgi:hypothetical protein